MKKNTFLSAEEVAAICCDEIIPEMNKSHDDEDSDSDDEEKEEEWLIMEGAEFISKKHTDYIQSIFVENDINSFALSMINDGSFNRLLNGGNTEYDGDSITELLTKLRERIPQFPQLKWRNLVQAAMHENGAIGSIIKSVLDENESWSGFQIENSRRAMIEAIKKKWSNITSSELEYIESMFERAVNAEWRNTKMIESSVIALFVFDSFQWFLGIQSKSQMSPQNKTAKNDRFDVDIDTLPDLSSSLLRDIYGVHKVFMFGTFKFKSYESHEFVNDIKESSLSDDNAVSICKFVKKDWSIQRLSLYPSWLIRDDLFQVFAVQFAVSHLVNSLEPKHIGNGLSIHCVVIPESVVSLYDHDVHRNVSIDDINISAKELCAPLRKDIVDVAILAQHVEDGFLSLLRRNPSKAVIMVDRRGDFQNFLGFDDGKSPDIEPVNISIAVSEAIDDLKLTKPKLYDFKKEIIEYFEQNPQIDAWCLAHMTPKQLAIPISNHCGSKKVKGSINSLHKTLLGKFKVEKIKEISTEELILYTHSLRKHHVVELEYQIKVNKDEDGKTIKAYLHFGYNQCTRFWPEHLLWFIPRLFWRENGNNYHYLKKMYGSEYKHGFSVNLENAEFSRFYKLLTGWDHVSVNYRRKPLMMERRRCEASGFRDLMDIKLTSNACGDALRHFVDFQGYDSDAIFGDINKSVLMDCNIANLLAAMESGGDTLEEMMKLIPKYLNSKSGKCTIEHRLEPWNCPSIKLLIISLQTFQAAGFEIDAGNLEDFDHSDIIRQMDHLVTVHALFSDVNSFRIRNTFKDQIQCNLDKECTAFGLHRSRQREADKEEETEEDEIAAICSETKYSLCSAHCYLLHSAKYLYRMIGDNKMTDVKPFSMEVVEEKSHDGQGNVGNAPLSIDWGQHILQWLPFDELPNFKSFLEEMARNPASTVSPRTLEYLRAECEVLIEGTEYELDEMIGLKAYSDLTKFQKEFRRAHWKRTELEIKKNFYYWASTMYKAFLFHSKPIQKKREFDSPIPIYHGLDRMFTVDTATPSFQGPFSTTISDQVVRQFASDEGGTGRGLEFTLQSSYHNPLRIVTGINMIRISSFKHEQEILLYAQSTPISKTKAYEKGDEKLVNHLISSVQKRETLITDKNAFYKQIGFKFKKKWINLILKHSRLFAQTQFDHRIVAHRLQHELDILMNKIKIHYGENNRLEIESEVQFEIMSSLKLHEPGVYFRITEDIKISSNAVIGVGDENENMVSNTAKYIILESSRRITNGGVLQNIQSADRVIALYGVDGVQNDGVIDCGVDGLVVIECSEFVNNGVIAPRPIVVIGRTGTDESFIRHLATMNKEEPIELTVRKHRGHYIDDDDKYHPQNLLKEGTGNMYFSGYDCGPSNEDWIVFEHDEESRFIPTTVIIRNDSGYLGIKRIAIYGGNNIDDLQEWVEIDGIHNENRKRQIFPIGSEQRWIAYIEQFKYFKLRILENHGDKYGNVFYEFAILGARIS